MPEERYTAYPRRGPHGGDAYETASFADAVRVIREGHGGNIYADGAHWLTALPTIDDGDLKPGERSSLRWSGPGYTPGEPLRAPETARAS